MGCITSKKDVNDLHPNIFQVSLDVNVDGGGKKVNSGTLEVNESSLVLYQKGKQPVKWPLKSLRRYGYERQVFSIEAGRRCPTGPGIYAFSCQRAERLFNLVQANVQMRNNEDTISRDVRTPTPNQARPPSIGYLELTSVTPTSNTSICTNPTIRHSLPRLSIHNNPSRLSSVGSSNGCVSPSPPPNLNNNYSTEFFPTEESISETVLYMNVNCGLPELDEDAPIYANLGPGLTEELASPTTPPPPRNVNYIVLDLDNPTEVTPKPPESPDRLDKGYVTIDFDKTVALSHSVNPSFENEGSRKTRHNPSINDLISSRPFRHSASLSD